MNYRREKDAAARARIKEFHTKQKIQYAFDQKRIQDTQTEVLKRMTERQCLAAANAETQLKTHVEIIAKQGLTQARRIMNGAYHK